MNRHVITRFLAVSCAYLLADGTASAAAQAAASPAGTTGTAAAVVSATTSASTTQRLAASYAGFAGSEENAASLVKGLRDGGTITLRDNAAAASGSISFKPSTRPMGWGNVRHALTLAQRELAAQGIARPTPAQLQAALTGGSVVNAAGKTTVLPGILTLRSKGMGWGQVARAANVPMRSQAAVPLAHDGIVAPRHAHAATGRAITTAAVRPGTITTAGGQVVRAGRWSGDDGAIHARTESARAMPASAPQLSRPTVTTPLAAAGDHGGFGGGHGRGR